jgi:hypothetical protein
LLTDRASCSREAGLRRQVSGGRSREAGFGRQVSVGSLRLDRRFSEDIDVTAFRDDLDEAASIEELEALSNKKRGARLDAIRNPCRTYIQGPLVEFLAGQIADAPGASRSMKPIQTGKLSLSGILRSTRTAAPM